MLAAHRAIAGAGAAAAAPPRGAPASAALASRLRALSVAPACLAARPRRAVPARRRARVAAAAADPPPPPGGDELEGESALVRAAIAAADNSLASLRGNLEQMESQTKELRAELARALREELPGWYCKTIDAMGRFTEWAELDLRRRVAETEAQRAGLLEERRAARAARATPESRAPPAADIAMTPAERAAGSAWGAVFLSLLTATGVTAVAGLAGVSSGALFPDPSIPDVAALAGWAAWTAPYVGGTLALGAFFPSLLAPRGVVRLPALDFAQLPLLDAATLASLAAATAYAGVVVWQGAFLQAALGALGAPPTALDPDSADALRGALGSLVAAPRLPRAVVAPVAVAFVAALEPAWFALRVRAADFLTPLLAAELKGQAGDELRASAAEFAEALVEQVKDIDPASMDAARPVILKQIEENDIPALLRVFAPPPMGDGELAATAARVGAASAWLGAEALAANNAWWAVLTSAAGVGAALWLSRWRGSGGGGAVAAE